MTQLATLTLPLTLTNDNEGRTKHWSTASKRRGQYATIVRVLGGKRKPFEFPVALTITRIVGLRQRLWDADSIGRGSVKELIDSLVECGWLVDDGPKHVSEVRYRQLVDRKSGPAVKVEFFRA